MLFVLPLDYLEFSLELEDWLSRVSVVQLFKLFLDFNHAQFLLLMSHGMCEA